MSFIEPPSGLPIMTKLVPLLPAAALNQITNCSRCSVRVLCLAGGLDEGGMRQLDTMIGTRRRIKRGEYLLRRGEAFSKLYAVHLGHFKTTHVNRQGTPRVTGFALAGDLLGMSAIASGSHEADIVALEDSEVCEVPYERLAGLLAQSAQLLLQFHRLLSQEIVRDQTAMLFLGNMPAEQRLAHLLLNLSSRYAARGLSPSSYLLRMSREDIGAYLGLTVECISRVIARFRSKGWIRLEHRDLEILDRAALEACVSGDLAVGAKEALAA
jgi:CRP/FNR family transcriptional regulator